jgi:uncharacterized protein (TIGR02231 family)
MLRSLSIAILLFLGLALTCQASPYRAILYPEGATLFEQQKLAAGTSNITLDLPQVARPDSLRVTLGPEIEAAGISAVSYRSELPEQPGFEQLRAKIAELKEQLTQTEDSIQAAELALDYWRKQEEIPVSSLDEAKTLSTLIRSESQSLLQDISQTKREQTQLQQQQTEAEKQLQELTGNAKRVWRVDLQLSAPLQRATTLDYDYRITKAGWKSTYRLNAVPIDGRIEWSWHAEITQTTGSNWDNVALEVATSEPVFTLTPPDNSPWILREREQTLYRETAKMMVRTQLATDSVEAEAPIAEAAQPQRTEGQLFDIYDLGRLDIGSGKPVRIQIRSGHWPAEFSYLTRPLQSPQAFLTAKPTFADDFLPLPSGTATLQIDGVHVGRRTFALNERQDVAISFGSDPGINIEVATAHVAGNAGLLTKKETYNWNWEVTLTNNKSTLVDLRVEDSYPHPAHDDIEIEERFTSPLPSEEDGLLSWQLELAPGAQQTLNYGYRVSHPEDMDVSLGR